MFNTRLPHFRQRIGIMLLGNFFMGFFLSILLDVDLGMDPYSCMIVGASGKVGLSFGTTIAIINCILLLPSLFRKRSLISFGSVVNMFLNGYVCDFFVWVWSRTLPEGFFGIPAIRWGGMVLATLGLCVSAAAYMASDTGVSPFDSLPFVITDIFPRLPFTPVRIACDMTCVLAGFLLGATLGPVTVIMAFCTGPFIRLIRNLIDKRFAAWDAAHPAAGAQE